MSNNTLSVPVRPNAGKSATKQIRKQGLIPAVEYGLGKPPVALSVNPKDIAKIIASDSGVNTVITLQRSYDINRKINDKYVPSIGRLQDLESYTLRSKDLIK